MELVELPDFGSSVELPETDMVRMQQQSGGDVRVHDPTHDAERRVHCVYVVDDDQSMRATLSSLFRSVDLGVELFESAAEFLSHRRSDGRSCLV